MKLVTFTRQGVTRMGVQQPEQDSPAVVDILQLDPSLPVELADFLQAGEPAMARARAALRRAGRAETFPIGEVKLEAPIPRPGKILCVGLNYRDHAEEGGMEIPAHPTIFAKYANCINGPYDPIVIPRVTSQVDWEGELGVVIGRRAKYISKEVALGCVGGYVAFNDVSGRDYQFLSSQWTLGKTFDTFGPMGPALVTTDEIPDPSGLEICTRVNGEVVQASNTRHLIFDVPYLVSFLSEVLTLEPGDLIITGTPAGVGFNRDPKRFLCPGDIVQVEIEKIGRLENPVISEA